MTQVLQFPKEKSKRVLKLKRVDGQRAFLTLSLFSFILVAVLSNEQVMKNQRPVYLISDNSPRSIDKVNRAIASAQPMNLFRDVEWEHDLARRLAEKDGRAPASASKSVTLMDHFRFGALAGKYRIITTGSDAGSAKIGEVEYIDSLEIADRPVQIRDHGKFLMQYRSLLPVEFSSLELASKSEGAETWSLISDSGREVGRAALRFDENGNLLGLKVGPIDRVSAE